MNIKRWRILLVVVTLAIVLPVSYVEINKMKFKNRVQEYLITHQHYEQADIQEIEGIWGKKMPAFYVKVIFTDEPNIVYNYFAHGKVRQFEYAALDGQQLDPEQLRHYVEEPPYSYELK